MNEKITDLCKQYDMCSPAFIRGVVMYATMLEGHNEPDGIILGKCEKVIKVWAERQEPDWDIETILELKRKWWKHLSIVRKIA